STAPSCASSAPSCASGAASCPPSSACRCCAPAARSWWPSVRTELARQYEAKAQEGESPRARRMALLDAYYHGCQYDHLPRAWDEDVDSAGNPVPFRQRRPSTVLPVPRVIVDTFCRALWGAGRRPKVVLADGTPDDNAYVDDVLAEMRAYRVMAEATRRAFCCGTGLVVWRIQD